jgi:hypothetical protein
MKFINLLTAIFSLLLVSIGFADDKKKTTTYSVGMTGVTWGGCQKHVREAFATLEGVDSKTITFGDGAKAGTQKVTFHSSSAKLKKEDAVKSLGAEATKYVVVTFEPQKKK